MNVFQSKQSPMIVAYVALGANLGDRELQIRAAATRLQNTLGVQAVTLSPLLNYPAVGGPVHSPDFLNAAAEVLTSIPAEGLLQTLLQIEAEMGRVRHEKWGPRLIDLDLILYADQVIARPLLKVPHPLMAQRRFVLEPLAQLAPNVRHPVFNATIAQLLQRLG